MLRLGLPLVAGMFIMVLYNLVDTFFIGLMRDDYQLAAVNLAYLVMMISIAISNMVGAGAASLISRCLGKQDIEKANHTLTVGFTLTVIDSVLVAVIGILFLPGIVRGLGAKDNTFSYTEQYVFVLFLGSLFTMGNYTFGQLLRSEGSVKYSVLGMIVSGIELCVMGVYGIFAPVLIGIFTDSVEVIRVGSKVLRTIMCILPFVGAVSMSRTSFQAMGKAQFAFVITLVRQMILYVPLLLVLNRVFGFDGMIWAQPVTEVIMMAASVGLLAGVIRREDKGREDIAY